MKFHTKLALAALAAALAACNPTPKEEAPAVVEKAINIEPAAPAAAPAPAAEPVAASNLAAIADFADKYPHEAKFLEEGAVAERLKVLLGERYGEFVQNFETAGPLTKDGERWFVTGNRNNAGGEHAAALVVDPAQDALRVWLLAGKAQQEFAEPAGASVQWPADVATMIQNAQPSDSDK